GDDGVRIVRHRVPSKANPLFALAYPFASVRTVLGEAGRPHDVIHVQYPIPALPLALCRRTFLATFQAPVHREMLSERQGSYALPDALQRPAVAGLRRAERLVLRRAGAVVVL